MNALAHIHSLLALIEQGFGTLYETALDDFAEEHHAGIEKWLEKEWADLLSAETAEQRIAALKAIRKRYEELKEQEDVNNTGSN